MSLRGGIVGISGFGGGEAMRLIAGHPSFELAGGGLKAGVVDRAVGAQVDHECRYKRGWQPASENA